VAQLALRLRRGSLSERASGEPNLAKISDSLYERLGRIYAVANRLRRRITTARVLLRLVGSKPRANRTRKKGAVRRSSTARVRTGVTR
jgi:hypothetical protein